MPSQNEYDLLIDSLVEREDTFSHSGEFTDSSMLEVKRELDLLQGRLRLPAPEDEFEEESACEQALELVEAIGRDPSFSTRQLAAAPLRSCDAEDPLPGGGVLGQYRLLMKLGEGGFGAVYKALHSRLDKVVALKVLTPSRLQNPQAVSRFDREMRAVGKLHHVNIVAAHDAGEFDGVHYLVMELVDGIDLRELVKQRGRLPIGAACELIRQAAMGLQHAHEHGLVHRDIKPSNLMLTLPPSHDVAPSVKVLDLGLALLDEDHLENFGELTATGQVMGTLEYMAPEQGADTHDVDTRADIYSLGASLYKLLTGKAPFSSEQYRSPVKLLMALATQDPPPLTERCPEITPDLEAIVQRMLSKSPTDRFATTRELAEALAPFSQPADVRALVDFLATTSAREPVDVNAAAFIGTQATKSHSRTSPQGRAPETTSYIARRPPVRGSGRRWASRIALALATCGILIAAAMYVIEVRTSRGTLIVHSDYPGIQVKIKRGGQEVVNGWSLLKGEDNKQLIRTGEIEIELPAELTGEYTVTPNHVTLTKGKQEIVKIERKETSHAADHDAHEHAHDEVVQLIKPVRPPSNTLTEAPDRMAADRERAAAKWIINLGGKGSLSLNLTQEHVSMSPAVALPETPFELTWISLPPSNLNNDDLKRLIGLKKVRSLHLNKSGQLDAEGVQHIAQLPRLQSLEMEESQLTTSALKSLSKLSLFNSITINAKQVDDNWRFIKDLPYLRTLRIRGQFEPNAADFQRWGEYPQLREIDYRNENKPDEGLTRAFQEKNPRCQIQVAVRAKNSEDFVTRIVGKNPIRSGVRALLEEDGRIRLAVIGNLSHNSDFEVTTRSLGAEENGGPPEIRYVRIPPQVKNADLSGLGQFPFVTLDATGAPQADQMAANLPALTVVQEVNLSNSGLTDAGLRALQRIDPFVSLNVQGTQVTKVGIETFLKYRPACTIHSDFGIFEGTLSTDHAMSRAPAEQPVSDQDRVAAQNWITFGGSATVVLMSSGKKLLISQGDRLPAAPFEFRTADRSGEIDSAHLATLVGLPNLQSIEIRGGKIDAQAIRFLSQIPNLRKIRFVASQIWTSEFGKLRELSFLHEIVISAKQVDDDWKFLGDLPHLRTLILNDYREASLSDFQKWSEFPQLRTIQIDAQVKDEMIAKLQEKNSLCRIIALAAPPKTWKPGDPPISRQLAVAGSDPVRAGAQALLSNKFRLSTDDRWDAGHELTLASVRDQRLKYPFTVRRVWVPPQAPVTWDSLCGFDQFDFFALDATGILQADKFVSSLPGRFAADEINLSKSDLTDRGFVFLLRLEAFPVLKVSGTRVTQAGIEAFKKARPTCRVISNFDGSAEMMVPDEVPPAPVPLGVTEDRERAAAELWQQRLGNGLLFTYLAPGSANFDPFSKLPDQPIQFVHAHGTTVQGLSNEDLGVFANLGGLKFLEPTGPQIDTGAIPYLKQIPTLIDLELKGARISSSAIAELGSLPHLRNLGVAGKLVDDQWKFLNYLPRLRSLRINDLQPTSEDWQRLQAVRNLRQLHFIPDVELDAADVSLFQQNNPLCRVIVGYPKKRSLGRDPLREAVRQLTAKEIGIRIHIGQPSGATVQQVLCDPFPFYVDIIEIKVPKGELPFDADGLKPLQAFLFNEVRCLWEGGSADEFVAILPDDLAVQRINLAGSDLTDKGLLRLQQVAPPTSLDIRSTKVTREGVMAYQKAVPTCKVLSDR